MNPTHAFASSHRRRSRIVPRGHAGFSFAVVACCMLTLLLPACKRDGDSTDKPYAGKQKGYNVVLVTLDTTRADRLSTYGFSFKGDPTTPTLDALADDGVQFDFAIAPAGATPISHATIMSGLDPPSHGVRVIYADSGYYLSPGVPTLATILRPAGWETAAFLSAFPVSDFFGFHHGFDHFDSGLKSLARNPLKETDEGWAKWNVKANQRRSDATTDAVLNWLASRQSDKPFFMWIHYWDPHDMDILPPDADISPFVPGRIVNTVADKLDVYAGEVSYVDKNFGRVIQYLKDHQLYDNTVFAIIADHGEGLGDHDWWYHRILYQEQIHVPFLMKWPGGATHKKVATLVRARDLAPTLLDVLNVAPPQPMEGESLVPIVDGAQQADDRIAFSEAIIKYDFNAKGTRDGRPNDQLLYVAMDHNWKLIYRPENVALSELFNLRDDPREQNNLWRADHQQYLRLKKLLDEHNPYVTKPFPKNAKLKGRDVNAELGSLGYTGSDEGENAEPTEGGAAPAGEEQPDQPTGNNRESVKQPQPGGA